MMRLRTLLEGMGLGAVVMYLFDPNRGKLRRTRLREQTLSSVHTAERYWDKVVRDANNRLHGIQAELHSLVTSEPIQDRVIAERVRAKMGRYVSHPGAIDVKCHDGYVTLKGPILAYEVVPLLSAIRTVRGVKQVDNQLDVYEHPERISSLQGGVPRPGERMELLQDNWSPATRFAVGAAGAGMMLNCLSRRTVGSALLGTVGFGMLLRAMTNLQTRPMVGADRSPEASRLQQRNATQPASHQDLPGNRQAAP